MGAKSRPRVKRPTQGAPNAAPVYKHDSRAYRPGGLAGRGESVVKHTKGWPDREIGVIAARQRTLVDRKQLYALGLDRGMIGHGLERGRLYWVHRGVYSLVPPNAWPPLAREQAAVMACGRDTYLSHRSAAAAWGIRPTRAGPVQVTVIGRDLRHRDEIRICCAATVEPRDTRTYEGIPITSPARTLLDIAPDLNDRELEKAFDEAIATGIMTIAAARATLLANPRRPGWRRLHALAYADRNTTMTRSEAEERFLALIRKAALPEPEVNARLGRWTVDFLWRAERVVVEIDGHAYHSSRWARERDHLKDGELQQAGLLVIRISARRLKHAPEQVLVQVVTALARAQPITTNSVRASFEAK